MKKYIVLALTVLMVLGLMGGMVVATRDAPNWDISGTWYVDYAGGEGNRIFVDLVQDADGEVFGEFQVTGSASPAGSLTGYVSGNDVYLLYEHYVNNYEGPFEGTITKNGMSGTAEFTRPDGSTFGPVAWSTEGSPQLLYEARFTGGGQIRAESGELHRNGRDINYRVSFGLGQYIVNGQQWFDGMEVTFHNVSNEDVKGGKFVASSGTMQFINGVGRILAHGTFDDEPGYSIIFRATDDDAVRIILRYDGENIYNTYGSGDFADFGVKCPMFGGNMNVEDLR